jgi:8-oxo-dGTP diphosphatase
VNESSHIIRYGVKGRLEVSIIEVIARALILRNDEILLAHAKGENNTFLPGGHVEFGECTTAALKREFEEELGLETETLEFIGVLEYKYGSCANKNEIHHEINLIFHTKIKGRPLESQMKSKERKLEFFWVKISELEKSNLLPKPLIQLIPKWIKEKKVFFKSAPDPSFKFPSKRGRY